MKQYSSFRSSSGNGDNYDASNNLNDDEQSNLSKDTMLYILPKCCVNDDDVVYNDDDELLLMSSSQQQQHQQQTSAGGGGEKVERSSSPTNTDIDTAIAKNPPASDNNDDDDDDNSSQTSEDTMDYSLEFRKAIQNSMIITKTNTTNTNGNSNDNDNAPGNGTMRTQSHVSSLGASMTQRTSSTRSSRKSTSSSSLSSSDKKKKSNNKKKLLSVRRSSSNAKNKTDSKILDIPYEQVTAITAEEEEEGNESIDPGIIEYSSEEESEDADKKKKKEAVKIDNEEDKDDDDDARSAADWSQADFINGAFSSQSHLLPAVVKSSPRISSSNFSPPLIMSLSDTESDATLLLGNTSSGITTTKKKKKKGPPNKSYSSSSKSKMSITRAFTSAAGLKKSTSHEPMPDVEPVPAEPFVHEGGVPILARTISTREIMHDLNKEVTVIQPSSLSSPPAENDSDDDVSEKKEDQLAIVLSGSTNPDNDDDDVVELKKIPTSMEDCSMAERVSSYMISLADNLSAYGNEESVVAMPISADNNNDDTDDTDAVDDVNVKSTIQVEEVLTIKGEEEKVEDDNEAQKDEDDDDEDNNNNSNGEEHTDQKAAADETSAPEENGYIITAAANSSQVKKKTIFKSAPCPKGDRCNGIACNYCWSIKPPKRMPNRNKAVTPTRVGLLSSGTGSSTTPEKKKEEDEESDLDLSYDAVAKNMEDSVVENENATAAEEESKPGSDFTPVFSNQTPPKKKSFLKRVFNKKRKEVGHDYHDEAAPVTPIKDIAIEEDTPVDLAVTPTGNIEVQTTPTKKGPFSCELSPISPPMARLSGQLESAVNVTRVGSNNDETTASCSLSSKSAPSFEASTPPIRSGLPETPQTPTKISEGWNLAFLFGSSNPPTPTASILGSTPAAVYTPECSPEKEKRIGKEDLDEPLIVECRLNSHQSVNISMERIEAPESIDPHLLGSSQVPEEPQTPPAVNRKLDFSDSTFNLAQASFKSRAVDVTTVYRDDFKDLEDHTTVKHSNNLTDMMDIAKAKQNAFDIVKRSRSDMSVRMSSMKKNMFQSKTGQAVEVLPNNNTTLTTVDISCDS